MKKLTLLFALLGVVALVGNAGAVNVANTGISHNTTIVSNPAPDNICAGSTLKVNHDGTFENGVAWMNAGEVAPYYGAFAEGYTLSAGMTTLCGMRYFFSTLAGYYLGQLADIYAWDASGSNPGNVISLTAGVNVGVPGTWPTITPHDIDIFDIAVPTNYFVGYWGVWPGATLGWFCAIDVDGLAGLPRTNIAPGIGYPTGWQNPSIVWSTSGVTSMGIGVYELGGGVPTDENTWGSIKNLYR